jgi:hypothetical protein
MYNMQCCISDMPDKLAILTYVHQLRAHFENNPVQMKQKPNSKFSRLMSISTPAQNTIKQVLLQKRLDEQQANPFENDADDTVDQASSFIQTMGIHNNTTDIADKAESLM